MADASWPASLPQTMRPTTTESRIDGRAMFQPDAGPAHMARQYTAEPIAISGTLRMSQSQWDVLRDFYVTTLAGGTRDFSWINPWPDAGGMVFRFSTPPSIDWDSRKTNLPTDYIVPPSTNPQRHGRVTLNLLQLPWNDFSVDTPPDPPPPDYDHPTYDPITEQPDPGSDPSIVVHCTIMQYIRVNTPFGWPTGRPAGTPAIAFCDEEIAAINSVRYVMAGGMYPAQKVLTQYAFNSQTNEAIAIQTAWKRAHDLSIPWTSILGIRVDVVACPYYGLDEAFDTTWLAAQSSAEGNAAVQDWRDAGYTVEWGFPIIPGQASTICRQDWLFQIWAEMGVSNNQPVWYMAPPSGGVVHVEGIIVDLTIEAAREYQANRVAYWCKLLGYDAVCVGAKSLWYDTPPGPSASGGGPVGISPYTDGYHYGDCVRDVIARLAALGVPTYTNDTVVTFGTPWEMFRNPLMDPGDWYPAGLTGDVKFDNWTPVGPGPSG